MEIKDSNSVLIAEYAALRSEITTFINLEVQFLSVSVALSGVLIGIAAHDPKTFQEWFDLCPIPFLLLALLYADVKARVLRAASYIQRKLQPRLFDGEPNGYWEWERFIREEYSKKLVLSVMEWMRWLIFLAPALIFFFFSISTPPTGEMKHAFFPLLLVTDLTLIVMVVITGVNVMQHEKDVESQ